MGHDENGDNKGQIVGSQMVGFVGMDGLLILENLWNKFQRRSHYSNYNTRFCENLQIPKYNLEYSKKRFPYTALKAWNEIPMNIRELPTLYQYKKQLKSHLMS